MNGRKWLALTPIERFRGEALRPIYLAMGGSLDPAARSDKSFSTMEETSSTGGCLWAAACVFYGAAQFSKGL